MKITLTFKNKEEVEQNKKSFSEIVEYTSFLCNRMNNTFLVSVETEVFERCFLLIRKLLEGEYEKIEMDNDIIYNLTRKLLEFENRKIEVELKDDPDNES